MLAVVLGLGSSIAWGVSDFLGGIKSRRLEVLSVLLLSQAVGLSAIAAVVVVRGEGPPGGDFAVWAALSSVAGLVGLGAFYRGLAVGAMSVVAPISATAALIPVAVGIASGDRPSTVQIAGAGLALSGVALASRQAGDAAAAGGRVASGVGLALIAAVGFGSFFVGIDAASEDDVLWAILVNRVAGVAVLSAAALALRPRLRVGREHAGGVMAIGVLDMGANMLFAAASQQGLISLVAVAGSLYPIVTVLLARIVLRERVARPQRVGVVATLAGVVLITAGA